MRLPFLTALMFPVLLIGANTTELYQEPAKKIIKFGWDDPKPAFFEKNLKEIETFLPYDGTGINMSKSIPGPDGKMVDSEYRLFSKLKFSRDWFKDEIAALKRIKSDKLTHNFINTRSSTFTKEFDIFDDAFWEATCNNIAVMAWIAREGNCKGIRFDLEDYGNMQLWRYRASCGKSYAEAWKKTRERGKQWMKAIAKEYPDITIFCFFWLDLMMGSGDGAPLLYERLEGAGTGLLVAFINGIYDELPPGAKIVDGMEAHGYGAKDIAAFHRMRAMRENRFRRFIAPENQKKFRDQTSFAAATYISCYYNQEPPYSFKKAMEQEKMTPLEFFRRNFAIAVNYSDEYAWTWSESRKWYPIKFGHAYQEKSLKRNPEVDGPYIGLAIPGIEEAIAFGRSPYQYAMTFLKNSPNPENLVKNPGFEVAVEQKKNDLELAPDSVILKKLPNWETWQHKNSKGTFSLAEGKGIGGGNAIKLEGVSTGCAHQGIKINPNSAYIVRASAKTEGRAGGSLGIQWRNKDGIWCNHSLSLSSPFNEDIGNGWKRATIVVSSVPENTLYLSPMLNSAGSSGKDFILFDNIEVFDLFSKKTVIAPHLKKYLTDTNKKNVSIAKNVEKSEAVKKNLVPKGDFNYKSVPAANPLPVPGKDCVLFEIGNETYAKRADFFRVVGKGIGFSDDSACLVKNTTKGLILFHVMQKVSPGEKFVVSGKAKIEGAGNAAMLVYWRTSGMKGPFNMSRGFLKFSFSKDEYNGWKGLSETITIPKGVDGFTILLEASGEKSPSDSIWFDNISVLPIKSYFPSA